MKLAVALSTRADIQKRLSELEIRLANNAKVQEGDLPSEEPKKLLEELAKNIEDLEYLISKINLTNSIVVFKEKTISDWLAKRDVLKLKRKVLKNFLEEASSKVDRYSKTEIKIKSTVDVSSLQKEVDALAKDIRLIEEMIQEINWTTELIEK